MSDRLRWHDLTPEQRQFVLDVLESCAQTSREEGAGYEADAEACTVAALTLAQESGADPGLLDRVARAARALNDLLSTRPALIVALDDDAEWTSRVRALRAALRDLRRVEAGEPMDADDIAGLDAEMSRSLKKVLRDFDETFRALAKR